MRGGMEVSCSLKQNLQQSRTTPYLVIYKSGAGRRGRARSAVGPAGRITAVGRVRCAAMWGRSVMRFRCPRCIGSTASDRQLQR